MVLFPFVTLVTVCSSHTTWTQCTPYHYHLSSSPNLLAVTGRWKKLCKLLCVTLGFHCIGMKFSGFQSDKWWMTGWQGNRVFIQGSVYTRILSVQGANLGYTEAFSKIYIHIRHSIINVCCSRVHREIDCPACIEEPVEENEAGKLSANEVRS